MTEPGFRRFAASAALLSAPVAVVCLIAGLAALQFDLSALGDPARALRADPAAARLAYWSMLLDLFGYYLLLLPAALVLWRVLRAKSSGWADLISVAGVGYIFVGAAGAAVLAAVWPPLIQSYATSTPEAAGSVRLVFESVTAAVDRGLWNTLELILGGVWWVGVSRLVPERRLLAGAGYALGGAAWLDAAGTMARLPSLASVGLSLYVVLAPLWALLCGLELRRRAPGQPLANAVGGLPDGEDGVATDRRLGLSTGLNRQGTCVETSEQAG